MLYIGKGKSVGTCALLPFSVAEKKGASHEYNGVCDLIVTLQLLESLQKSYRRCVKL